MSTVFQSPPAATILSVSTADEDHVFLENSIREDPDWVQYTNATWKVRRASTPPSAIVSLMQEPAQVVVCDAETSPGSWRNLLEQALGLPDPPSVILSSRFADDRLWAEAINLGAFDVLAKPFVERELIRISTAAWVNWVSRQELKRRRSMERWAVEQWNAAAG